MLATQNNLLEFCYYNENDDSAYDISFVEYKDHLIIDPYSLQEVLGYTYDNINKKIQRLENDKYIHKVFINHKDGKEFKTVKMSVLPEIGLRGKWFLTESGFYQFVTGGTTDNAKLFNDWVCGEVLPALRKHGYYQCESNSNAIMDTVERRARGAEAAIKIFEMSGGYTDRLKLMMTDYVANAILREDRSTNGQSEENLKYYSLSEYCQIYLPEYTSMVKDSYLGNAVGKEYRQKKRLETQDMKKQRGPCNGGIRPLNIYHIDDYEEWIHDFIISFYSNENSLKTPQKTLKNFYG